MYRNEAVDAQELKFVHAPTVSTMAVRALIIAIEDYPNVQVGASQRASRYPKAGLAFQGLVPKSGTAKAVEPMTDN